MMWRIGRHYPIHVYDGDRPVATFFLPEEAKQAVVRHNLALEVLRSLMRIEETLAAEADTSKVRKQVQTILQRVATELEIPVQKKP